MTVSDGVSPSPKRVWGGAAEPALPPVNLPLDPDGIILSQQTYTVVTSETLQILTRDF